MTERAFTGVDTLLIDGNNLLHRVAGRTEPEFQRQLLSLLRATIPQFIQTIVILDGHAVPGTSATERVARNFEVRHSGSITADDALVLEIERCPFNQRHLLVLVTDDRALTERARTLGALTQRLAWLQQLLERSRGRRGTIGAGKRAAVGRPPVQDERRRSWQPGRGATRKVGNPRRRRLRG